MLYNPQDREDKRKINFVIAQNFSNLPIEAEIPPHLQAFVSRARLVDMLDFDRVDFKKRISLSPAKKETVASKWKMVKIEEIGRLVSGKRPKGGIGNFSKGTLSLGGEHIQKGEVDLRKKKFVPVAFAEKLGDARVKKGDILMCKDGALSGKVAFVRESVEAVVNEHIFILRIQNKITNSYIFHFLASQEGQRSLTKIITGAAQGGINSTNLKRLKIPLPPLSIQKKIISECRDTEQEVVEAQAAIGATKEKIEREISGVEGKKVKLSSIAVTNPSKREIVDNPMDTVVSFIDMASVSRDGFVQKTANKRLKELKKGSYTYFKENDIIIAKIAPCMENGKCALVSNLTNGLGMGSSEFHVVRALQEVDSKFLFYFLNRENIRSEAQKKMTGASGHRRVPISFYENLKIPLPPLDVQKATIARVEKLEKAIEEAQQVIDESKPKKEAILKKYLLVH